MKNVSIVVVIIIALCAFGAFIENQQKKAPQKPQKPLEVYMGETLNVTGLDITVTDVKVTKNIHNYKPKNVYLQTFVTIKNTRAAENTIPTTLALIHRNDDQWICMVDGRFHAEEKYNDFILNGFVIGANQEMKGYIPFKCDAYLNEKAGANKSKPADFKLFAYNKQEKDGGYIFLEKRPQ